MAANAGIAVKVLPEIILDEIFCLSNQVNDVIIDHLCSDIEQCGYAIRNILNLDCSIIFKATANIDSEIVVEIRIDRIFRTFEVVGRTSDFTVLPINGSWDDILIYLQKLVDGT